jgi:hypothetical protein
MGVSVDVIARGAISSSTLTGMGNVTNYSASVYNQFYNYSQSLAQVSSSTQQINVATSSLYASIAYINALTGAFITTEANLALSQSADTLNWVNISYCTSSLNAYTSSQDAKNGSLALVTASLLIASASVPLLNQFTASQITKNNTLQTYTASVDASSSIYNTKWTTLTNVTSSILAFTASNGTISLNSYTSSNDIKWTTLTNVTSSLIAKTGSYATTGSNVYTGSQTISGSVYGNVITLSIASNTASMDLSKSNLFTLTLVSGSTTQLVASNIQQGQTINVLVTQPASGYGNLSYNSTYKFPLQFSYTASAVSNAQDILTFITFNTASLYASSVKQLQ